MDSENSLSRDHYMYEASDIFSKCKHSEQLISEIAQKLMEADRKWIMEKVDHRKTKEQYKRALGVDPDDRSHEWKFANWMPKATDATKHNPEKRSSAPTIPEAAQMNNYIHRNPLENFFPRKRSAPTVLEAAKLKNYDIHRNVLENDLKCKCGCCKKSSSAPDILMNGNRKMPPIGTWLMLKDDSIGQVLSTDCKWNGHDIIFGVTVTSPTGGRIQFYPAEEIKQVLTTPNMYQYKMAPNNCQNNQMVMDNPWQQCDCNVASMNHSCNCRISSNCHSFCDYGSSNDSGFQ